MKGHIRERSPGHYAVILDLADPATGKRRRKWHSFTGTKREAQIECARLIAQLQGGFYAEPSRVTVAEFINESLTRGPFVKGVHSLADAGEFKEQLEKEFPLESYDFADVKADLNIAAVHKSREPNS